MDLEKQNKSAIIDLTHPITNLQSGYPGDELPRLDQINDFTKDGFNNFRLSSGMHIGTHIDGPMHMTESKPFIDEIPLDRFIGIGCLLDVVGVNIIPYIAEYKFRIVQQSIVVIYTGFGNKYGIEEYYNNYPVVSMELAQFFIEKKVKMICLDTPSPDKFPHDVHRLLLKNSVLIAENLTNLERLLTVRNFEIVASPLSIHADSSPARIFARI